MKKLATVLCTICLILTMAAVAKAADSSWTGYISDEKCGAQNKADCAKKCIEGGSKAIFVNDDDKSVVAIINQDAVKAHAGHHVKLTGSKSDDGIHVDKVEMVAAKGGQ